MLNRYKCLGSDAERPRPGHLSSVCFTARRNNRIVVVLQTSFVLDWGSRRFARMEGG